VKHLRFCSHVGLEKFQILLFCFCVKFCHQFVRIYSCSHKFGIKNRKGSVFTSICHESLKNIKLSALDNKLLFILLNSMYLFCCINFAATSFWIKIYLILLKKNIIDDDDCRNRWDFKFWFIILLLMLIIIIFLPCNLFVMIVKIDDLSNLDLLLYFGGN